MKLSPFLILAVAVAQGFGLSFESPFESRVDEDALVETQYGKIQGTTTLATNGKLIYSFKSIPFAKPPVRFEPPVALDAGDSWGDEIRDGTKNPPSCAQTFTNLSPASEDCLYLNVYTPVKPGTPDVTLPVMFFIYGGANLFGDSVVYGPNRLMAHEDVVLVVIHYRVGALGFLSTGDGVVPGNNGFKDQREALRWVQDNIGAFNGDPSRVTIFGESAGSSAVISHLLSPSTQGLFHRVIAQSGTPLSLWSGDPQPLASARQFAQSVKCDDGDDTTAEMVDCLKTLPWEVLANATLFNLLSGIGELKMTLGGLGHVVEPDLPGAFFTEHPLTILKEGRFPHDIPVILGANQHDASAVLAGLYFIFEPLGVLEDPDYVRFELVPTLLNGFGMGDESLGSPLSQSLAEYYYPPDARRDNFTEITDALVNMLTVIFFKAPILRTADYLSQHSDQIYLYNFEREGYNTIWTITFDLLAPILGISPPVKHGVMHADELIYFWTLPFIITGEDREFSNMVCKMWTDFAATSNPTPAGSDLPTWTNYKTGNPLYYKLDLEPELILDYTKNWRQGYQN